MPALLELTSESNGYATSRPVTAASIPRRDYPRPRMSRSWDTRSFLGAQNKAFCTIEALARIPFSKKHAKSGFYY